MPRFSETLLDHARSPRNAGILKDANAVGNASLHNKAPRVTIYLKIDDNIVARASFQAFGSGVTIACCSILNEMLIGRSVDDCHRIEAKGLIDGLDGVPTDKRFCAELALNALQSPIDDDSFKALDR